MSRKLITGFFGVNNLGDDIMLDAFFKRLQKKEEVSLLRLYAGWGTDTPIKTENISMFPHGKSILVSQYFSRKYDGFFWIGGTCMTDSAGDGAYGYMNSFKSRGKRIGYIGIGINEIHNQERKRVYKNVLDRADIVTIRDKHSYSIAKELSNNPNILLTEDLVYLSDEIIRPSPESRRPILLIAWRSLAGYYSQEVENKAIESLVELVRKYSNDYEKIIVTSLGNQVDDNPNRVLFAKLASITDRVQFVESMSFGQRIELICTSTTVITGRLHGIFIAEWNNINTIAIGYDTKVKSFLESIDRTDDLVYPNNLNFDELERALLARHEALTMNDWLVKHNESMKNVQLFEDMI